MPTGLVKKCMRLSNLQKFILLECLNSKTGKILRGKLNKFYEKIEKKPKIEMMTKIITQSMERLIEKELLVGFGERTSHKWFIKEIKITPFGRRVTKKLLGEQMSLPFSKSIKALKH
ncbi:MAG: hypothetical protein PHT40_00045 [Patescibacteria group bacterium]|nr:hypothetical protein [Patescibacteria group bacterium]